MVELSSLDVHFLALELRALEDGYVDKVYQPTAEEFLFKVRRRPEGATFLFLRPGAFAALAPEPPAAPETPTTLAMTLRKHLVGARIRRVDQHEFDRVLRFSLERKGEPYELVAELFGKGNLILAGPPDGRILLAMRTETFAHRTIRRGEPLVFPPPRVNPLTLTRSEFDDRAQKSDKDVVRFLALDLALGGPVAEETVHRAGAEKSGKIGELDPEALDRLWKALRGLLDSSPHPAVAATVQGLQLESIPFEAPLFRDAQREPARTLSEAVLQLQRRETERTPTAPDPELARLERQIGHQERGIQELDREAAAWERRGHLLFANYQPVARVLQKSKASVEASSWLKFQERVASKAKSEDDDWKTLVESVDPQRARIVLRIGEEKVPLDPFGSLEQNATLLYDEAKRIRAKLENAKVALAEARKKLAAARTSAARPAPAAARRAPLKRFWFESYRWFFTSEGLLVVAGRDVASNERLFKRHLKAGDVYVHADFHGAPSCVVKTEGGTPGEPSLAEACQFAATYSRAFAQFAQADAYWVRPEQVSKQAESGEYVPKGAFVIRGQRNYQVKLKLEAAIGIVRLTKDGRPGGDDAPHPRLMGGPPRAVVPRVRRHVLVEHGDLKPTDAAKRLAPLFGVTLEEAQAVLPPGNVRILEPEAAAR